MSQVFAIDCDFAFEKFKESIIEEVNNHIPLKRSKILSNQIGLPELKKQWAKQTKKIYERNARALERKRPSEDFS